MCTTDSDYIYELLLRRLPLQKWDSHSKDSFIADMEKLENDLLTHVIKGKPLIQSIKHIRSVFKFCSEKEDELDIWINSANDLRSLLNKLPEAFKTKLDQQKLSELMFEFHASSHVELTEYVHFLSIIAGRLIKRINEGINITYLKDETVSNFLMHTYTKDSFIEVLQSIGMLIKQSSQRHFWELLHLNEVYSCTQLFINWLEEEFYNYVDLPLHYKVNMNGEDKHFIDNIFIHKLKGSSKDKLEIVAILNEALAHMRKDIIRNDFSNAEVSLISYLMKKDFQIVYQHELQDVIPQTILLKHYVDFRISLTRVLQILEDEPNDISDNNKDPWQEQVQDLWTKHLPGFLEISPTFDNGEIYGFQRILSINSDDDGLRQELKYVSSNDEDNRKKQHMDEERAMFKFPKSVASILQSVGLTQYEDNIRNAKINGPALCIRREKLLHEIGISSALHKIVIMDEFERQLYDKPPMYTSEDVFSCLQEEEELKKYSSRIKEAKISGDMLLNADRILMCQALTEVGVTNEIHLSLILAAFLSYHYKLKK